jgi:hypothetical protein
VVPYLRLNSRPIQEGAERHTERSEELLGSTTFLLSGECSLQFIEHLIDQNV